MLIALHCASLSWNITKRSFNNLRGMKLRRWPSFHCPGYLLQLPIVAVLHGTANEIAWKIVDNGFSALSTLDSGYYGQGSPPDCSPALTLHVQGSISHQARSTRCLTTH